MRKSRDDKEQAEILDTVAATAVDLQFRVYMYIRCECETLDKWRTRLRQIISRARVSRDLPSLPATSGATSLVTRRLGGWRIGGSHEYVRCPVRQPASIDER